jgi:hypothetical protein
VDGTTKSAAWLLGSGLSAVSSSIYERRADGVLVFHGERPGDEWVAHGYFGRWIWTLVEDELRRERLLKRRWRHPSGVTQHSRPPDETRVYFCTLIIVIALHAWLASDVGVHSYEPAPGLDARPSMRTVQRWLARALPLAPSTEQRVRAAVLERGEPRPMKKLFPSGLSPPGEDDRRRWRDASLVGRLRSALTIVVDAVRVLDVPLPLLLAEARGRCTRRERFLL